VKLFRIRLGNSDGMTVMQVESLPLVIRVIMQFYREI